MMQSQTKKDLFSDYEEEEETDFPEEEEIKKNFPDMSFKFSECNDQETFDPVLSNVLCDDKGTKKTEGKLETGILDSFGTIFECVQKCGGWDLDLFTRITSHSNQNAEAKKVKGRFRV